MSAASNVTPPVDLIKAVRSGLLTEVVAALDAGAQAGLHDGSDDAALALAIACFMGHAEIVLELVNRGEKVNWAENRDPKSPLSMAIRGGKTEVVKLLIELGVEVPSGVQTGLTEQELMLATWKANHYVLTRSATDDAGKDLPFSEEIHMLSCYGTDTNVLDSEMQRTLDSMNPK